MKNKIFCCFLSFITTLTILTASLVPCFNVSAAALPTPPPNLELVKPQLEVIRGNAYQYALEQSGFDVQNGFNATSVLAAVDAACKGADYAFSGKDDYSATIQYVKDKSGLPESLQGFNAEVYFAKINYLDMELGIWLNEKGQIISDAGKGIWENVSIRFKEEADNVLNACKAAVENNCLNGLSMKSLGIDTGIIVEDGSMLGMPNVAHASSTWYQQNVYVPSSGHYEDRYRGSYVVPNVSSNSFVFLLKSAKSVSAGTLFVIQPITSQPTYNGGSCGHTYGHAAVGDLQSEFSSMLANAPKKMSSVVNFNAKPSYTVQSANYKAWQVSLDTTIADDYLVSYGSVENYPVISMDFYDCVAWMQNTLLPRIDTLDDPCVGYIALNPNGLSNPLANRAFNMNDVAAHNHSVTETVPEIDPRPSLVPIPEGQPLYPPVSQSVSVPKVEPVPFPQLDPVKNPVVSPEPAPNPDPVPDPDPEPETKPDTGEEGNINFSPLSGLKNKFPFCVPFDLIESFQAFDKKPDTPKWEFTITIPHTNYSYDFVVDLAPLSDVAKLCRTLILVLFIIGLILATRRLISN